MMGFFNLGMLMSGTHQRNYGIVLVVLISNILIPVNWQSVPGKD